MTVSIPLLIIAISWHIVNAIAGPFSRIKRTADNLGFLDFLTDGDDLHQRMALTAADEGFLQYVGIEIDAGELEWFRFDSEGSGKKRFRAITIGRPEGRGVRYSEQYTEKPGGHKTRQQLVNTMNDAWAHYKDVKWVQKNRPEDDFIYGVDVVPITFIWRREPFGDREVRQAAAGGASEYDTWELSYNDGIQEVAAPYYYPRPRIEDPTRPGLSHAREARAGVHHEEPPPITLYIERGTGREHRIEPKTMTWVPKLLKWCNLNEHYSREKCPEPLEMEQMKTALNTQYYLGNEIEFMGLLLSKEKTKNGEVSHLVEAAAAGRAHVQYEDIANADQLYDAMMEDYYEDLEQEQQRENAALKLLKEERKRVEEQRLRKHGRIRHKHEYQYDY